MNMIEFFDNEIAKLQAAKAAYLGASTPHTPTQPTAKPVHRVVKGKRFVSEETRAKMKASQAARHARNAVATAPAEPVAASVTTPTTEPMAKEGEAKKKPAKAVVNPSATSAMQSIMPPATN